MRLNPPWLIAGASILALGGLVAKFSHAQFATPVSEEDGRIVVHWVQPNPGEGKIVSLICLALGIGSIKQGLTEKESKTSTRLSYQEIRPAARPSQRKNNFPEGVEPLVFDEDIPVAAIAQSAVGVASPEATPSIYERIKDHTKGHLILAAETGSGKTTFLLGLIQYLHQQYQGNCHFYGSTSKASRWLGLEDQTAEDNQSRVLTLSITQAESILLLINRLRWLQKLMEQRQIQRIEAEKDGKDYNPKPVFVMLDEWMVTLAIAGDYDRNHKTDTCEIIKTVASHIAIAGREDRVFLWVFLHDHQVQNSGINLGYQKQFSRIVLGSFDVRESMEEALIGRTSWVRNKDKRRPLWDEAQQLMDKGKHIAYATLRGDEIFVLPNLPDIKGQRLQPQTNNNVVRFPQKNSDYELEDYWNAE